MEPYPSLDPEVRELMKFAEYWVRESGSIILKYFGAKTTVEIKADRSPVTIADKQAEEILRNAIAAQYPDHGIIGEEFGDTGVDAEYVWVLDPIDGTKSFITGVPLFGTLVALCRNMVPIFGIIHLPALQQFFIGTDDRTLCNGIPVSFRACPSLDRAVLLETDHRDSERRFSPAGYRELLSRVFFYRTWGDCFGYTLLCNGLADIMLDPVLAPWDMYALIPVIKGAGGIVTDMTGGNPLQTGNIIAAHPSLHAGVLRVLCPETHLSDD